MRTFAKISRLSGKKFIGIGSFLQILAYFSVFFANAEFAFSKKWIVKVKNPSGFLPQETRHQVRAYQTRALASELNSQAELGATVKSLPSLGINIVEIESDEAPDWINNPNIAYAEADVQWKPQTLSGATPSGTTLAPWLEVLGLGESDPDAELTYIGASPVIVGVVDTGATVAHPYLSPALAVNSVELAGITGVDDDDNGYIDDIYGGNAINKTGNVAEVSTDHGSHVAGLVKVVRDQAIGDYPEARAVQILPIRFIDSTGVGSTAGALEAVAYAISRGVKVLNASWGARGEEAFSQALYDAMVELYSTHDVTITVAAGNSEGNGPNDNDLIPYFPAGFNIPGLMTVGSVTPEYSFTGVGVNTELSGISYSDFSNYGSRTVHIAAPGNFRNAQFDSSGVYSVNAHYTGASSYYVRKKGTSMAAPVIAGIAAVVRAINPSLTAYETKQLILDTAELSDEADGKTISGAIASAANAFAEAEDAISTGLNPEVSGDPYTVYEAEATTVESSAAKKSSSGGGCGAITENINNKNDKGPHSGPLGGNSLAWLIASYFLFVFLRKSLRKV